MKLTFKTPVKGNFEFVASQFNEELFKKMALPLTKIYVGFFEGTKKGDSFSFTMKFMGFHQFWEGLIVDNGSNADESFFIDIGKKLPFPLASWSHRHSFQRISDGETLIVDEVEYSSFNKLFDYLLFPFWQSYFNYRSYLYKKIFG